MIIWENYKCSYDINFNNGDVQINLDGDDQVISYGVDKLKDWVRCFRIFGSVSVP